MKRTRLALGAILLLACTPVPADEPWALCPVFERPPPPTNPDDPAIHITADEWDGVNNLFSGRVTLEHGERSLTTDRLRHDEANNTLAGDGAVRYHDDDIEITSGNALLDVDAERVRFGNLDFRLFARRARGSAESIDAVRGEPIQVAGVEYTTCPEGSSGWALHAPNIALNTETGVGVGRNVRVDFLGVPIFYTPWISFPLDDARKSGFLVPDVSRAHNTGLDLRVPWYWNIASNRDATITPRWMEDRGVQLAGEYRYLNPTNGGEVYAEYLPSDTRRGDSRGLFEWRHDAGPAPGWQYSVDFHHVTDPDYFEDLAGSLDNTVVTHLGRHAALSFRSDRHAVIGRLDGWQTLDRTIPDAERPYARLPQVLWYAQMPLGGTGLDFSMASEAVYFHADDGVREPAGRLDIEPTLAWAIGGPAWHVVPRASWRHTRYALEDGGEISRSVPKYSVDAGLAFQRTLSGARTQTLEPRLLWLEVPYRNQDAIPLFDTSIPDFNMVQLFHDDRFNGADRVGDTRELALGLASSIYAADGTELLTVQAGRIRYFDDRRVTLPGEPIETATWSDYLAEATARVSDDWSTRMALQLRSDDAAIERSAVVLSWHPGERRLLNLGWRYRRDEVDQADISFAWPINDRWSAVGRWNWSIKHRQDLETFAGLEYQSCCWAIRVVSREYIANLSGDTNRSLYLQLELKGLANVGRGTEALLERGILGYSSSR
ncbi:MAG: LPS assembly protein LptD [Gammaproteobacteria bacterium]